MKELVLLLVARSFAIPTLDSPAVPLFKSYALKSSARRWPIKESRGSDPSRFLNKQINDWVHAKKVTSIHAASVSTPAYKFGAMRHEAGEVGKDVLVKTGMQGVPDAALPKASIAPDRKWQWTTVYLGIATLCLLIALAFSARGKSMARFIVEEHTMRMLIIPGFTACVTMTMTRWNYVEFGVPMEERTYYVSNAVNYPLPESWSSWLARWSLWHFTILFMTEFKCRVLPGELHWFPILWALCLLMVIWSGIHQWDVTGTYCCEFLGIAGPARYFIHALAALTTFLVCWFETVCLWWPHRGLHLLAGLLTVAFLAWDQLGSSVSSKFVSNMGTSILEFSIFVLHTVVVWIRAPLVKEQVENNTWRPWIPCCHCLCPTVQPGNQDMFCPGEIIGEPVEAKL